LDTQNLTILKKKNRVWIFPLFIIGFILIFTSSCKKDETTIKKDPVITWENPADITYGTLLSATQLNATADVPGTFVYTPETGAKLNVGANQDLKVDFTPDDSALYNKASKAVKINVLQDIIVFNPNLEYGSMTDQDGNIYKTIRIGTQVWMAENLRTTKYNDGTSIPYVTDNNIWAALTTPAYCWYNNNESSYGALYNWYTVNTGKLAPSGWHVPSNAEWLTLVTYLGGASVAGGKLKETGFTHWHSPNTGADNSSGFTALPGSSRVGSDGSFNIPGEAGIWWCSLGYSDSEAWFFSLYHVYSFTNIFNYSKCYGFSVRCVKD
jgi:uncharacterized protein (TIGR02145 family)